MDSGATLQIKFWGVRGSIPTPECGAMSYGGNTACVEVSFGDQPSLILDAGSGIRRLGMQLLQEGSTAAHETNLLFTHFHWDHIQGLPFFAPLYDKRTALKFYSSRDPRDLRTILEQQMRSPYFPVDMPAVQADYECRQIDEDGLCWGDVCILPFPLKHPGGATGYRIQSPNGCIVYASDHEHGDEHYDAILRKFSQDADILIYDAQYTPEEYVTRHGWGHSTWQIGTRVARDAGVKQLALFHHDPGHGDSAIDDLVRRARAEFPNTLAAREGSVLQI